MDDGDDPSGGLRVAFIGNSIQYYNDCPRFVANLSSHRITQFDSYLRGGANLSELWDGMAHGVPHWASMRNAFATEEMINAASGGAGGGGSDDHNCDAGSPTVQVLLGCIATDNKDSWNFVVMNDHTQGPAREESRKATLSILLDKYLPLIIDNGATLIIIETAAYRYPGVHRSEGLGSTQEFQQKIRQGVQSYIDALRTKLPETNQPRMAPVGTAFLHVHDDNYKVWESLFDPFDHFHPSPSGTYLQGCVLYWTMFHSPPPLPKSDEEISDLWKDARVMHDVKKNGGQGPPLPTLIEAEYLWNVAKIICGTDF